MNSDQVGGILRAFIPVAVAACAHYGVGSPEQVTVIATAIATCVVAVWSAVTNKPGTTIPAGGK